MRREGTRRLTVSQTPVGHGIPSSKGCGVLLPDDALRHRIGLPWTWIGNAKSSPSWTLSTVRSSNKMTAGTITALDAFADRLITLR